MGKKRKELTAPADAPATAPISVPETAKAIVKPEAKPEIQLTFDDIKKYVNDKATDKEVFQFLQLCKSQRLNPFIKEAYLIKYGTEQATFVVGKDVFTKRANHNPVYDGSKAGIIVRLATKEIKYREGSFFISGEEILLGGWAETYRKDKKIPFRAEVGMVEYSTNKSSWNKMPATMIRKVALVQSLREAFPDDFQGLYDASEMGIEMPYKDDSAEINITPSTAPVTKPDGSPASAPASTPAAAPAVPPVNPDPQTPAQPDRKLSGWTPEEKDLFNTIKKIVLTKGYNGDDIRSIFGIRDFEKLDYIELDKLKKAVEILENKK